MLRRRRCRPRSRTARACDGSRVRLRAPARVARDPRSPASRRSSSISPSVAAPPCGPTLDGPRPVELVPVTSVFDSLRHPGAVRNRAFGHADEKPYRRLTGDWIRVAVAIVLVTASVRHHGDDTAAEVAFKNFWSSLPAGLHGFFEALSRLGSLWAVALVAAAALFARRWRLALELAIAGGRRVVRRPADRLRRYRRLLHDRGQARVRRLAPADLPDGAPGGHDRGDPHCSAVPHPSGAAHGPGRALPRRHRDLLPCECWVQRGVRRRS